MRSSRPTHSTRASFNALRIAPHITRGAVSCGRAWNPGLADIGATARLRAPSRSASETAARVASKTSRGVFGWCSRAPPSTRRPEMVVTAWIKWRRWPNASVACPPGMTTHAARQWRGGPMCRQRLRDRTPAAVVRGARGARARDQPVVGGDHHRLGVRVQELGVAQADPAQLALDELAHPAQLGRLGVGGDRPNDLEATLRFGPRADQESAQPADVRRHDVLGGELVPKEADADTKAEQRQGEAAHGVIARREQAGALDRGREIFEVDRRRLAPVGAGVRVPVPVRSVDDALDPYALESVRPAWRPRFRPG